MQIVGFITYMFQISLIKYFTLRNLAEITPSSEAFNSVRTLLKISLYVNVKQCTYTHNFIMVYSFLKSCSILEGQAVISCLQ